MNGDRHLPTVLSTRHSFPIEFGLDNHRLLHFKFLPCGVVCIRSPRPTPYTVVFTVYKSRARATLVLSPGEEEREGVGETKEEDEIIPLSSVILRLDFSLTRTHTSHQWYHSRDSYRCCDNYGGSVFQRVQVTSGSKQVSSRDATEYQSIRVHRQQIQTTDAASSHRGPTKFSNVKPRKTQVPP
ncbi:hypothetical protein BDW42DRAFT_169868 [Aspergillus taichungensis]|uniref:Uncharacterized protein n=1 Tax=Aspergillus taichungensis TaxID=482145 RepID=A0A2J5HUI7_9EURO|nr:hypothetical protein BDW42DRAFT_169868 [Aspergillus taichungensis]